MKKAKREGTGSRAVLELTETSEAETRENARADRDDVWDSTETRETETADASEQRGDIVPTVATVAVVCVAAAAFEAALLPGIVIGIAAAAVPGYLPHIGAALKPLFRTTVRGVYRIGEKSKKMIAEAHEQVQDIVAEANAENDAAKVTSAR
jgi:Flp pilus assembly protein TadB